MIQWILHVSPDVLEQIRWEHRDVGATGRLNWTSIPALLEKWMLVNRTSQYVPINIQASSVFCRSQHGIYLWQQMLNIFDSSRCSKVLFARALLKWFMVCIHELVLRVGVGTFNSLFDTSGFENAVQLQDVRDRCTEGIRAGATNLSSLEDREGGCKKAVCQRAPSLTFVTLVGKMINWLINWLINTVIMVKNGWFCKNNELCWKWFTFLFICMCCAAQDASSCTAF